MKKTILYIVSFVFLSGLVACSNFESINTDPNSATKVPSGMLATKMIINATQQTADYPSFMFHNFLSKHAVCTEHVDQNQYNMITNTSFGSYIMLRNIEKMVNAASPETKNTYTALGLFLKAYELFYVSIATGDIPYKDALAGESQGLLKPRYDSQKQVMQEILADLAKADQLFAGGVTFDGDPIFKGDPVKWRQLVNTFRLKVLINLNLHTDDKDLNVKQQFQQIVTENVLMKSNDDNFQLTYANTGGEYYPFNDLTVFRSNIYCVVSSNLVDSLKAYHDNRLFYFAEPAPALIDEGKTAGSFDAYVSIDPSAPFSDVSEMYNVEKKYCPFNKRYSDKSNPAGEPVIRAGYAEQCFIIAEAIVRGWIPGDAKSYYDKGVEAAMLFVKDHTPAKFVEGRPQIDDTYIQSYLTSPKSAFATDKATELKQIFQQKYFIYFLQSPWDGYYECRRTGYPNLPINPATNLNQVKTQLPKRWTYSQNEYNQNGDNLKEALQRQFGGRDDNNDLMWILKN